MSDRLPPEVQAVLDAAGYFADNAAGTARIVEAVVAYRASLAPPDPFEALWVTTKGNESPADFALARSDSRSFDMESVPNDRQIWRCTVTPVERIR